MSEREQFEAWWIRDVPDAYKSGALSLLQQHRTSESYGNERCQSAWEGWQAALKNAKEKKMPETEPSTAYAEGFEAWHQGYSVSANPYSKCPVESEEWIVGWNTAHDGSQA